MRKSSSLSTRCEVTFSIDFRFALIPAFAEHFVKWEVKKDGRNTFALFRCLGLTPTRLAEMRFTFTKEQTCHYLIRLILPTLRILVCILDRHLQQRCRSLGHEQCRLMPCSRTMKSNEPIWTGFHWRLKPLVQEAGSPCTQRPNFGVGQGMAK